MADPVEDLLPVVRRLEGSGDNAVSPAGAIGRYQIMPDTARGLGIDPAQLKDPAVNEKAARGVLSELTKRYPGDTEAVLAAYNAGPKHADKYLASGRDKTVLPLETQRYIARANIPPKGAAPTLPDADEAFAAPETPTPTATSQGGLPDADTVFGADKEPGWSARVDQAIQASTQRIERAFGVGAQAGFGDEPIATPENVFSKETTDALKKWGLFNDYAKGQADFTKAIAEGIFRPAAAALALGQRAFSGLVGGIAEATGQASEETGIVSKGQLTGSGGLRQAVSDPSLLMASPLKTFPEAADVINAQKTTLRAQEIGKGHIGGLAEPEDPSKSWEQIFSEARANGVLGEGDEGHFDAVPLTPEKAQERVEAAQEAGTIPPIPRPVPPDIHTLARRIDPETFEKYDSLAAEKGRHRATISGLGAQREELPEAREAQEQIKTILSKVHGVEDRLTNKARERLADAQDRLDKILTKDTPEMADTRKKLLDADFAMRDLAPDVADAYKQASDLMPTPLEKIKAGLMGETSQAALLEGASKGEPMEPMGNMGGLTPEPPEAVTTPPKPGTPAEPPLLATPTPSQYPSKLNLDVVSGRAHAAEVEQMELATKARTGGYGNLREVKGTGDIVTRKLSEGVEAKAVESELTDRFGDLPEYRQLSMANQAEQAGKLLGEDYEQAKAVAMGQKQPPKGVLPESVFVAVEKRALAEGDVDTLRELATNSKLTTAATTMGQRIRTLGERDPSSPVGAFQEIRQAREADLAQRNAAAHAETVKDIKTEMTRAASKSSKWEDFINAITCEGE